MIFISTSLYANYTTWYPFTKLDTSAVNIPFEKILNKNKLLEKDALENVFEKVTTKDRRIIFSCGSGVTACINALGATVAGYPDISVYDGSWSEWGIPSELPITE